MNKTLLADAQLFADQFVQADFDFHMARDGRFSAVCGVDIDIVPLAVPIKLAPGFFQISNELTAFHTWTSISLV
jgi:hypothetical protein